MFLLFLAAWATILLEGRIGVPKNPHKAFDLARFGAENGCPHCTGVLARCHLGGDGCQEDLDEAKKLAKESAAAGSHYGDFVLGYLAYDRGHHDLAKRHWQKAASLGLAVAMVNLATMYLRETQEIKFDLRRGLGSERATLDVIFLEADAFELLNDACQKGHPKAWQELGVMYFYGTYVPLNMDNASVYFERSRKAGNVECLIA
jgi:TPR repeat protein